MKNKMKLLQKQKKRILPRKTTHQPQDLPLNTHQVWSRQPEDDFLFHLYDYPSSIMIDLNYRHCLTCNDIFDHNLINNNNLKRLDIQNINKSSLKKVRLLKYS